MGVIVSPSVVVNVHISVRAAAEFSGYSLQYLHLLILCGKLTGVAPGQIWLIDKTSFDSYLERACQAQDRRFMPKYIFPISKICGC